jgi:hypothetical protein
MTRKAVNNGRLEIKGDDDTYIIKVPTGPLGWKHFRILMEVENERANCPREPVFVDKMVEVKDAKGKVILGEDGKPKFEKVLDENGKPIRVPLLDDLGVQVERVLETPALKEVMMTQMDKWVELVLPSILISHELDEIPWTQLMAIFTAAVQNISIDNRSFRDMDEPV